MKHVKKIITVVALVISLILGYFSRDIEMAYMMGGEVISMCSDAIDDYRDSLFVMPCDFYLQQYRDKSSCEYPYSHVNVIGYSMFVAYKQGDKQQYMQVYRDLSAMATNGDINPLDCSTQKIVHTYYDAGVGHDTTSFKINISE